MKQWFSTLTAERDSSKLERKPWLRNGLNLSGPVASKLQASHSRDETSEIEEMMESEILLGVICFSKPPLNLKPTRLELAANTRRKKIPNSVGPSNITSKPDPVRMESCSETETSNSFGSTDFFDPQNSALILDSWTAVPATCLDDDFACNYKNQMHMFSSSSLCTSPVTNDSSLRQK